MSGQASMHQTTHTTPLKLRHQKHISRKALPLPILSLQNKQPQTQERHLHKGHTQNKSPIRQNFKKILQIINQSKKKTSSVPANFQNQAHSKDISRKKQGWNPRPVNHIMLKTYLINTMERMQNNKTARLQQQSPLHIQRKIIPNLHRTIRFNTTKSETADSHKFKKWQSFCTSISYHNKKIINNLPSLQLKKKFKQRSYLKRRSESTVRSRNEDVNAWQNEPIRYNTEFDNNDFSSDLY